MCAQPCYSPDLWTGNHSLTPAGLGQEEFSQSPKPLDSAAPSTASMGGEPCQLVPHVCALPVPVIHEQEV